MQLTEPSIPLPTSAAAAPCELFAMWPRAQFQVVREARESPLPPHVLRRTGFLRPELAERVSEWFIEPAAAPTDTVRRSYRALERDTARLFEIARRPPSRGGLGIQVRHVHGDGDPYDGAADLCAELREHRSMSLTTIASQAPHPLLGGAPGGVVDQLRVVPDVFGHAALGVGFDLRSEFATWLQCRALFSTEARPAAFVRARGRRDGVHRRRGEARPAREGAALGAPSLLRP
jgi:hypothetical protein